MNRLSLLFPILLIAGCVEHTPSSVPPLADISLNGTWCIKLVPPANPDTPPLFNDKICQPMQVPANWFTQGVDHHGVVWYQTHFSLPELASDQMATLIFNGVDYAADVTLNQRPLGQHKGYFQRFAFDITPAVGVHNRLLVKVDSPNEQFGSHWPMQKELIKGMLDHHDTRPGGAWSEQGQDANSGGIWQPVAVHVSRIATIDSLLTSVDWQRGLNQPQLKVDIDYRAIASTQAELTIELIPDNFTGRSYHFSYPVALKRSHQQTQQLSFSQVVPNPTLWWPSGYGEANRYQLRVSLRDSAGLLDQQTIKTGLRKVSQDSVNNSLLINDKRMFVRGTNYVGSVWLGSMSGEKYHRDLQLMREANINTVRVHAHIAGQALYEQADRMGMLLWQDFPLQWAYDDSAAFAEEAKRQTHDMLRQLGNHPSIIVWAGQNEPPFDSPWMKSLKGWTPTLNKALTEQVAQVLSQDHGRITRPWSSVNEHPWLGWYSGKMQDYLKPTRSKYITEFGAQALPNIETLRTIIPADKLWPGTPDDKAHGWDVWHYHNFQPSNTFALAKVPMGNNIEELIANTQKYQADLIQLAAESYRRQRYQPVNMLFQFMFSETWPSINWAVVDYLRQPKPGYYALQRAYQPVLPSIQPITQNWIVGQWGQIGLWAINDRWQAYPGATLHWRIQQAGHVISQGSERVDLAADSGQKVVELKARPRNQQSMVVEAELWDRAGNVLGKNQFSFSNIKLQSTKAK
ncbi:glycoside hydrolase family 2 [Serratia sp. S1B]|nr:glycoside hydrolase family 2 [Serratia sp. S1B]